MVNNFFISNSNLDTTNATLPPIHYETESRLNSIKCCELEICDILKSLDPNKASGADGISPRMLKYTASSIYPSLTRLFNISLEQKIYPSVWKNANVTSLYKKGDASLLNNYRPISILSAVSKVMEKAIFKHTFNFIRDNNLLHTLQSGFMPGYSTTQYHLYINHVSETPNCLCGCIETPQDYFLECPLYLTHRDILLAYFRNTEAPLSLKNILYGDIQENMTKTLIAAVEQHICETQRFSILNLCE